MTITANIITHSNKQGNRDRVAFLVFVKEGALISFSGVSIPGVCAIISEAFSKNGKWFHTTYQLVLVAGVTAVQGRVGWGTGLMSEGVATATNLPANSWAEIAAALGATPSSVQAWVRKSAPRSASTLDERDAALAAL